jgi:hypothetical protein
MAKKKSRIKEAVETVESWVGIGPKAKKATKPKTAKKKTKKKAAAPKKGKKVAKKKKK